MSEPCCRVRPVREHDEIVDFDIEYCPLHQAAGELLEACKRGRRKLATYTAIYSGDTELVKLLAMWDAAIQKAESR